MKVNEQGIKKWKVLLVHNYYQIPGGEDMVVANEKKMLEENGHQVIVYSRHNSELKEMHILRKLLLPITTIFNPRTYREIRRIIRKNKIDIVHVHNTLNLISPAVYYAALICKVPVVQTIHNFRLLCPGASFYRDGHICEECIKFGLSCAVKHNCYRGSKIQTLGCVISMLIHRLMKIYGKINYICLTEFNKEKLLNLKQISRERVFVKPNFVDATGESLPAEQRKNQLVFAGRLDKLKGIDVLLKTWKQMGKDVPKLIVCGTGPMEEWCKNFIAQNRINVEMKGFVKNSEVRELLATSKALIMPTQWFEGFPMSIVEAFSVGTPVLCSNLGNLDSMVINGVNGWKFDSLSENELKVALRHVEEDASLYFTTIQVYNAKYTKQINYNMLCNIYAACK